ncbi:MAG: non-ribosomal peptide synthase/polyketide synthase [Acidobacteria bacterium]|nr:non-ribosomal peptide synthase/polyketide synthase [Acidobacteriota bacterium]
MKNVEDIYPLAPLQSGMLFHSLMAPESGVYVNQVTCTLPEDLDDRLFRQAWERLVERHGVLRTAFLWDGLDEPLQVVRKTVSIPWEDLDWRGLPAEERQRRFEELRHRDRHTPLPLNKAPLMRFSLVRLDGELAFVWTSHHLLLDGWSLPLLVRELVSVYGALREGREPALPPARPFGDYVAWLQRQDKSRAESFWRGELAGFTAPNPLGIAPPAGAERASGHGEHGIWLSREVTAELQSLATRHKLTLQTITLGAWAVLVSRYSNEEDVVFGGVVSGRPAALPGVETMVGMFVNTLPVRVRVNDAEPLAAWLQRLQERQIARQELEHTPLAEIQRWSEVPAGLPLFETLYVFENYPNAADGGSSGLRISNLRSFESTNYPLTLTLMAATEVSLHLTADLARVDGDAAPRLLQHLATLLAGMAGQVDRRAGELSLLTPAETLQLASWNATARGYPQACIHELFAEQAERSPDAVAVAIGGRELTYGEVGRRSRRLAHRLRRLDIGPGSLVGLCAESLPEMVVGMLGILAAGGSYVPLDLAYPQERLAFMLEDTGAAVMVAEESLTGRLPTRAGLRVELLGHEEAGGEEELTVSLSSPGDPAYVIYTSGSTGLPKGVVVPHRAVVRLVRGTDYVQLGPDDRVAQASNSAFDAATFEIWGALLNGARLVGIERETLLSPSLLSAELRRESVSVLFLTTALFNQMAREVPAAFVTLRVLLFGGERVDPETVRTVLRDGPPAHLLHVYGPTETTTFATWQRVEAVPPGETVPIGRPLANGTLYVLAAGLTQQPVGVPGELYLGGDGLAHGCHDRPELTAERFVPDPFGPHPGGRLYRTGDLVRQRSDGPVEFLGRLDGQVKIRGFRIELGEIEAALLELPGVREAVVLAREEAGDRRLVAYMAGEVTAETLRAGLRERLPDYMVPAAFVTLETLPLTPNGKVDRKALPAPEQPGSEEGYPALRTPVEEILAGIWAELLGLERVGADDHFFELGGHSLLATRVTSRLRDAFGVEIPLHDIFEAPRLADLAARVEAARRSGALAPAPPLLPVAHDGDLPLSFAQERLWFIDQLEPGSPLYNVAAALRVEGPLDSGALALTLGEIVRRHEALRTVFASRAGAPVQVIQPAEPFLFPIMDLSALPESAREALALASLRDEADRPFDLTRGPLLRGVLLRLAEEDHAVALTLHHIASDGWSMGVLVREVAVLYPAFAARRPSPLPELPMQYADFSVWQRSWLRGEVLEQEIDWWRRQLAGLPPLLELPTDRPRPAVLSYRGVARPVRLPAGLTRQMEALARREGATLFMVLLAGFQALLARYSGQDDLAVGSPVAGRTHRELEPLIGFFVNTLVLRGDLTGTPTFRELLGRVRETALAAWLHQDVPFEKLVEELAPERSLAHAPLFQGMLVLQNAPIENLEIENLRLRPLNVEAATAKFDLTVNLSEHDGGLLGIVEHATDLFDATTVERLLAGFERLLAAAVAGPDLRAAELPLLGAAERHQLLREWGGTREEMPAASTLHSRFAERARRAPEAPALTCGDLTVTYGELHRRSNQLARWLRRHGAGPESRVGLSLDRSVDLVVGILGVLKAGAAYVPLDPASPRERLAFVVADADIRIVVGVEELALLESLPAGDLEISGDGGDGSSLAYVIYTSGSTGSPKGALITHGNVARLFDATEAWFGFDEGDVWTLFHSYTFDFSVWEIWGALLYGGRLVIVPWEVSRSPELFLDLLDRERVTVLNQTPSAFAQLAQAEAQRGPGATALRLVIFGGEALDLASLEPWFERRGDAQPRLVNMYGITETTVHVTYRPLSASDARDARGHHRSVIGVPIPDLSLAVMDRSLRLVPIGVPGELVVGGAGLGRGYLGRPDLTAERFVPDPAGGGVRLYRSGDLGRFLPNGQMEYLGRLDHQVKIRGFRIELGEIEAALAALAGVRQAVVVVREDAGDRRLVAYVVGDVSAEALRQSLRERLPDSMVPAAFVMLDALPLTSNGKVDRKALPSPEQPGGGEGYLAPRTPVEEVLAGIWAEVLGLERVGAADHFFDLGGHSLLATQVMSRLRQAFGVEMPLRDLFATPMLADLAARVEAARRAGVQRLTPPLVPVPREGALPLSFAQERLWFIDQLEPGSPLYNVPAALRVAGPLDAAVLARCLGEILRRHEALRTLFAAPQDTPVQVIQPAEPLLLSVVDLSALPESAREASAPTLLREEAARPFDLSRGPLLRGVLVRLAECDHAVALTMHHIVSDGWSLGLLVREVAALYPAFAARRPSPLPDLPLQYADFAVWQRSWLRGEVLENEIDWWRRQLAGLPPLLEMPTDRPRPGVQSFRGAARPVRLPAELVRQAAALGRHEGATLFMVLLAAFQALLARTSGQDDLAVGSPVAGRTHRELEPLIGFFVNTLVLRGDLTGAPTFRELLGRVRETALAAWLHQDVPFERLVEELAPERSLAHAPLFQVVLVLQNAPVESLEIENLRLQPVDIEGTTAKFDLTVNLSEHDGGLVGIVEHATDLFDAATIDRLVIHYERLLTAALAAPERSTAELPLLGEAEQHQLLLEWGAIREEIPAASTLHGRFAARARRAPEAPALTCGEVTVTYGELDRRSNRLARWLRRQGAGPESRVGLRLDRSVDLVVGILGVLKAGAAYVPLDPGAPRERAAFVVEDAGVRIVVGEEELGKMEGLSTGDLEPLGDASSLAYVIYTSGSTGRPKGVLITHGNVVRLCDATQPWFGFAERDVWTLFHSYTFDFSVWEIWGALLYGGRLVVVPWEVSRSPELFLELLTRERVTVLNQTPSAFAQLAQVETERAVATDLRLVIFGGEALDPASLGPWFARHGDARPRLVNMYGITETTVHVTCRPLSAADARDARGHHRSVIGVPIPDLSLAVVDRRLRPAPIGVPGELVVGGAGLARGYLGRPELTAERFVPDPAGGGARLYRSGDLGRFLPNGEVEYLGRLDHQVKIRGFRIELGEIEAALALAGARQAVVVVREDAGDRRLVAYAVGDVEVAELRQSLRERLPDYMVPAAFVVLATLPLTPNGKVDRKALPAPERSGGAEGHLAPRTPAEEVLAGIWAALLGLERVGAADHFFDLGGHSLLATQVTSRLRQAFGVEMPLRDLFEAPVLADLAARVEAARRTGTVAPAPPLLPVPRDGSLPLSFAQQRLWFIDRVQPGSPLYNVAAALRVEGPLDAAVLARCFGEIVRRHEALRTVFAAPQGTPMQVIQPAEPFGLTIVDLSGLPEDARETLTLALAGEEAGRPFDLARGPARGPLLRGLLLRLAERDQAVLLTLHHIASDGWSLGCLVREVAALYPAFAAGRPSPLPELPVQYADFAVWQRSWLRGEVLEQEIAFWRQQLAGLPPLLELPTDRPRPAVLSHRGATRTVRLPAALVRQAEALGRREGATLFMVLLAGFQALLARASGQDDLAVGSPVAGRTHRELEPLIGFFANTLVLRGDLTGAPTFRELLGRVRETALEAWLHQDVPFEKLVEELTAERSLAHTPLFQAMLALQAPFGKLEIEDLRLRPVDVAGTTAKLDLAVSFVQLDGVLEGAIEYATALFDAATVDRLIAGFERLLAAAVAGPELRVAELALLSSGERQQLLTEWNDTGEEGWQGPVTFLVERWCRERPDAPAVVDAGGRVLTYGELGERAGRLAGYLRSLGVGPEPIVAVLMERSAELLVAQLGVLKAGAAYLSLDPARLDRDRQEIEIRSPLPALAVEPDHLAYVLYTSGSTGRPKGVQIAHRGLLNLVRWDLRAHGTGPGDHRTQVASLGFDASVWEIWACLASGATLHLPAEEARLDPERLAAWMAERGVTVSFLPTPLTEALLAGGGPRIPTLRRLLVGGDRLLVQPEPGCGFTLINHYGPAEATVVTSAGPVPLRRRGEAGASPTLGRPIDGLRVHLLDRSLQPVPPGVAGELWVGGPALARGYLGDPGRTAERFLPDPWGSGERLYRTGDLCRWRRDGEIEFLGRVDHQVKIRGQRIEPGEIEAALLELPGVREAVVVARKDAGNRQLVAYVVGDAIDELRPLLREQLRERLPGAMVPSAFVQLAALPLTPNGKVDRKALPAPVPVSRDLPPEEGRSALEDAVAGIWCEVLGVPRVGVEENFFDLGGHSLLLPQVQARLRDRLGREVTLLDLLTHTTVRALARHLEPGLAVDWVVAEPAPLRAAGARAPGGPGGGAIAIVGLAGRFPGAPGVGPLWANLRAGVSSIARFSDEELAAAGVAPELRRDPRYVPAAGVLDGVELFDAGFFGYSPREAELLDPQQRVFLECAWEALEDAGYDSLRVPGPVGVFASLGFSHYLHQILTGDPEAAASGLQLLLGNDKDFLATRVSYKLDLAGPSMTVQTACSSSAVAVHLACQNLRLGACDMALAGGVSIALPQRAGYLYEEGGIASPDGCCRAFDAEARGTVGGSGAGIVVLKRLEDALAHGDTIHAVLLGSAANNDGGSGKAGYTAPSVAGQAAVIAAALADAGVSPESIAYVEAHGSATPLGDPIEVAALTQAFRRGTGRTGFCLLGSVKTNVGHLDAAAGVTGLIKTVLALEHRQIPPSLHFTAPNPAIDFAASPFRVADRLTGWNANGEPRRAGVSAFGIGGTNVHAVLEEAPPAAPSDPSRPWQVLLLAARTPAALERMTDGLADRLEGEDTDLSLADAAYTLRVGRRPFAHRRAVLAATREEAAAALSARDPQRVWTAAARETAAGRRSVAFLLPGVGDQYPGLACGLYHEEPVFRQEIDRCAELLLPHLGLDLREVLFAAEETTEEAAPAGLDLRALLGRARDRGRGERETPARALLRETRIAQPAMFAVGYCLARLWMSWGVRPAALLGYSLGEYTAACLAGVMELPDALALVARRARLIGELAPGALLAVPLAEEETWARLTPELSLAAVNAPAVSVVAGPPEAVAGLERRLAEEGFPCRRLQADQAFHSSMMQPIAGALRELLRAIPLAPPRIPWLSNVTGTWISPDQATDPDYWVRHLVSPVRFADGVAELWREPGRVLLEMGPGQTLGSLALQQNVSAGAADRAVLSSLRHELDRQPDQRFLLQSLGRLWLSGAEIDWSGFHRGERRRRVPLPAYPFERQRYWIEPGIEPGRAGLPAAAPVALMLPEGAAADPAWTAALEARGIRVVAFPPGPPTPEALDELLGLKPRPAAETAPAEAPPSAGHARPGIDTPYEEPRTDLERRLAAIWGELLGIDRVGAHDSFFALGGHSLLGLQLVSRLQAGLGVELPLRTLFEAPTVAALAAEIAAEVEQPRGRGETAGVPPLVPVPREGALPLSFAQQRLWFVDQLEPGTPLYNLPVVLRVEGPLQPAVLERSLREIVRRHEAVRTVFVLQEDSPVQVIQPPAPFVLPRVDLSGLPEPAREAASLALAVEEAGRPFDLARDPKLRGVLMRLSAADPAEDHAVALTMHHVASDGWSMGLLVREVTALYAAFAQGQPSPLPELPVQYADFAVWQRSWLHGEVLEREIDWWRRQLAGLPPLLELPADRPRPAVQSFRGAARPVRLPAALVRQAEALGRSEGGTLFMVLLAAFQTLLARYSGQDDLAVGTPVAGRNRVELEGLIGFFVNNLVLRGDLAGDPTFRELLGRVRETELAAQSHQDVPFEKLVEELVSERSLAHSPLVQVMFALQNAPGGSLEVQDLRLRPVSPEATAAKFDLTLNLEAHDGGLSGTVEYATDLYAAATVDRLIAGFERLLAAAVADPELRVAELPLLSPGERQQVLAEWNDTGEEGWEGPVTLLVERWCRERPDAPAVVDAVGRTLTYGELGERSGRLAGFLRGLLREGGVGPEPIVAVLMERSAELLVGQLAWTATARRSRSVPRCRRWRWSRTISPTCSTPPARRDGPRGCRSRTADCSTWCAGTCARTARARGTIAPRWRASVSTLRSGRSGPAWPPGRRCICLRRSCGWTRRGWPPGWPSVGSPSPCSPPPSPRRSSRAGERRFRPCAGCWWEATASAFTRSQGAASRWSTTTVRRRRRW